MTECEARQYAAELQARGYKAHAHFEAPVDGTPERWRVEIHAGKVKHTIERPEPGVEIMTTEPL